MCASYIASIKIPTVVEEMILVGQSFSLHMVQNRGRVDFKENGNGNGNTGTGKRELVSTSRARIN